MLDVEEKNWYKLHAATYVQGNETACELGVGLHNLTGNAEHFVVSGELGSERSNQVWGKLRGESLVGEELPYVSEGPCVSEGARGKGVAMEDLCQTY